MFLFHIAFSLGLIALAAGMAVFCSIKQHDGSVVAKVLALLIILCALVSTVCTAYCGVDLWRQGYLQHHKMDMQQTMPMNDKSTKEKVSE